MMHDASSVQVALALTETVEKFESDSFTPIINGFGMAVNAMMIEYLVATGKPVTVNNLKAEHAKFTTMLEKQAEFLDSSGAFTKLQGEIQP